MSLAVKIIKKDGRLEEFRINKIKSNIESAKRVYGVTLNTDIGELLSTINQRVESYEELTSEELLTIIQ